MLCEATGYAAVSLQPNAGSQGEYAGLLIIKAWHESRGEGPSQRVPHSRPPRTAPTRPRRRWWACRSSSSPATTRATSISRTCAGRPTQHAKDLAAIMVTYPSTHGVFEAGIVEICDIVHEHGGQVYVDGANMNAMVGLAAPGEFGGDVSHLNLHKTFCIPHGGGGPGVGPVAVRRAPGEVPARPSPPRQRARGDRRGLGGAVRQRLDPADLVDVHRDDGRRGPHARERGRDPQRELHRQAPRAALPGALLGPGRARRARVHPRPAADQGGLGHHRGRRRQAPHRLRLPRADDVVPGRGHADGRADRERVEGRARPLLRRDDRDPRRDPRGGRGARWTARTTRCATRRTPRRWSSPTTGSASIRASSPPIR